MAVPKINILGDLSLGNNQLRDACLHNATGVSSPQNGQLYLSSTDNIVYYYLSASGSLFPLTSIFSVLKGGISPSGQTYTLSSGCALTFGSNATINSNRFNGDAIIGIGYGGTNNNSFDNNGITYYGGSSLNTDDDFTYDSTNKRIAIGTTVSPSAVLHLNGTGPFAYITPTNLTTPILPNSLEFNGTGLFYSDYLGLRYQVAPLGAALTDFAGVLPINQGGTNNTSYTSQGLIKYNGTSFVSFTGSNTNEVVRWNGTTWVSSSGGYISQVPNSVSRNTIVSSSSTYYPLLIQGASGQTTYFRIEDYLGTNHFQILANQINFSQDLVTFDSHGLVSSNTVGYLWLKSDAPSGYSNPYIQLRPQGARGAYIKGDGGGGTDRSAGYIDISAGTSTACPGGSLTLQGGSATAAGAGSISCNGGTASAASGGVLNTAGGTLAGGHIITSNGGGSLNTNSGFLQLGTVGKRATFLTQPTGQVSINLPTAGTGWMTLAQNPYSSGYAYFNGTGYMIATGVAAGSATTLDALTDVTTAGQASGDFLRYNGSTWLASGLPANIALEDGANNFSTTNIFQDATLSLQSPNSTFVNPRAMSSANYDCFFPPVPSSPHYAVLQNTYTATSGDMAIAIGSGAIGYLTRNLENLLNVSTGVLSSGQVLTWNGIVWKNANPSGGSSSSLTDNQKIRSISASFAGYPIASGQMAFTRLPYAGTIQKYTILCRPTGSLQFDIRPTGYSAYPTNNSICASALPNVSSNIKAESSILTGWNTALASGDCIDFYVTSGNALVTQATLILDILAT